ncbi:MAG: glycine reductase [Tissierellia bacterium]|nr:glycine reductase [Tissierellia bacterium]
MKNKEIITNNPKFIGFKNYNVDYNEEGFLDVLYRARNQIHNNYKLITHPLYGNITPTSTIFRSICVEKISNLDLESVYIIEDAIQKVERIIKTERTKILSDSIREDLEFIDYTLIKETLDQIL